MFVLDASELHVWKPSSAMSFLNTGDQNCAQYSKCGRTSDLYRETDYLCWNCRFLFPNLFQSTIQRTLHKEKLYGRVMRKKPFLQARHKQSRLRKRPHPANPVYRLVQDLLAVNAATVLEIPVVPNPHTLLSQLPQDAAWFTVIDLVNAFFSIPLHPDCQFLFAFIYQGRQLMWTVISLRSHLRLWTQQRRRKTTHASCYPIFKIGDACAFVFMRFAISILKTAKRAKKNQVHFDRVIVFYFQRCQGFTSVPSRGGCTLGMRQKHSYSQQFTLEEFSREQLIRRREKLMECLKEKKLLALKNMFTKNGTIESEKANNLSIDDICDEDIDMTNAEIEDGFNPLVYSAKKRRALLKRKGVKYNFYDYENSYSINGARDLLDPPYRGTSLHLVIFSCRQRPID
ncbi:unnamed protein product [Ranitomeya imitator]|uniref:Reverse transcriptase domain-containing protein n=1 Tax=Ranitomeya imitator TaxID=111125 RepID=A0ABN9M0D1_9NEOB|nr:unnamed protein product [Ranitomeya imitator]